ncbi:MAG: hypothetical protein HQL96_17375 [Magnetococcales bacterium]|nr:hypothetical protein [Magnetococcales bacterium]
MHPTIAFDSYNYVRKLREAGVDERQAAIQAETLMTLIEDRVTSKSSSRPPARNNACSFPPPAR